MDFKGYVLSLSLKELKDGYPDSYPFNIPSIRSLNNLSFHPSVTYITGDNGAGKSTLIEALAVYLGFNPEGGSKNFNFNTRESHSDLHNYLSVSKGLTKIQDGYFLRSESFFNVATEIDSMDRRLLDSYGGVSLHEQSHGESFWALFFNRFGGNGLYILDEPESALSATRQMAMLSHIHNLVNRRSQFIIITHSPILLAYPNSIIYEMSAEKIVKVSYKETEIYKIYKGFLDDTDNMLSIILD